MSYHEYVAGREISAEGHPFYGIVQAAMRQADSPNLAILRAAWPQVWNELAARYNAPGGALPGDVIPSSAQIRDEVWATLDPKPAPLESRIREVYRELGLIGAIREYRNSTRTLDGVCSANLAESKAWVERVCADESPAVTR